MQPIAQTLYSEEVRYNPIAEWNMLPDELILEIFKHLSTLERAKILSTCRQFNHLGTDRALLQTETQASQIMIREFVEKNRSAQLAKSLNELDLDWNQPWQSLRIVGDKYRFDKMSVSEMAALTVPLEKTSDPSFAGSVQRRFGREVRKQIQGKEGCYRFENGCMFTNDSFRIFMESICKNPKIERLVIQCDLSPEQISILSEMLKANTFTVPELYLKTDRKYSVPILQQLFDGIAGNQTLKTFEFYHELTNNELSLLNQALEQNQTLEKIGLNGGTFLLAGFQAFLGVLAHKPKVKSLSLKPLLEEDLIQELFQQLPQTSVENLELEFRPITDATGLLMSELIRENRKLKCVLFPSRHLSEHAAQVIAGVFDRHPNLTLEYHPWLKSFV